MKQSTRGTFNAAYMSMSGNNWLAKNPYLSTFLVGLAILLVIAFAYFGGLNVGTGQGQFHADFAYRNQCDICNRLLLSINETSGISSQERANCYAGQPDWCALAAQYRSTIASERSTWAAWFMVVLTIIGVWLLYVTLKETRRVATDTAKGIIEQNRPWISIEPSVRTKPSYYKKTWSCAVSLKVTNHGNWPATHVHKRFLIINSDANLLEEMRALKVSLQTSTNQPDESRIIFPREFHEDVGIELRSNAPESTRSFPVVYGSSFKIIAGGATKCTVGAGYLSKESLADDANWIFVDMGWESTD